MKEFKLTFEGYWRDAAVNGLPEYSGIYFVYKCTHNPELKKVKLLELLYIGQAGNIKERIKNHNMHTDFLNQTKRDEILCYSCVEVDKKDLDIVENALICANKPVLNTNLKDEYKYETASFTIEGKCALLKNMKFKFS